MSEIFRIPPVKHLQLPPMSVRVLKRLGGPPEALFTSGDLWHPIEIYLSHLGPDYLAGRVKQVANYLNANHISIFGSYSLVPVGTNDQAHYARKHRERLLEDLSAEYKNAVTRLIPLNPKARGRLRSRMNAALGTTNPHPDETDRYLSDHPVAIEEAKEIRALWESVYYG